LLSPPSSQIHLSPGGAKRIFRLALTKDDSSRCCLRDVGQQTRGSRPWKPQLASCTLANTADCSPGPWCNRRRAKVAHFPRRMQWQAVAPRSPKMRTDWLDDWAKNHFSRRRSMSAGQSRARKPEVPPAITHSLYWFGVRHRSRGLLPFA